MKNFSVRDLRFTFFFFFSYIQNVNKTQLMESWSSLLGLIKDGPTLNPSCQFIILAILNEFVQKCSPLNEKKDQKDLQDVTTKVCIN